MHARAALLFAVLAAAAAHGQDASATRPVVAHDFVLKATDGRNYRLSELRGEPMVLAFWGSWCGPCRESLRTVDSISRAAGVPALGVNLDGNFERASSVAQALQLTFPTLVDSDQRVARAYDVSRLPLTLLIDRDGAVHATWAGAAVDAEALNQFLASLRKE